MIQTILLWVLLVEIGILALTALFTNKGLFGYIFTTLHIFSVVIIVRLLFFDAEFIFWQMAVMVALRALGALASLVAKNSVGMKIANFLEHVIFGAGIYCLYHFFYMV